MSELVERTLALADPPLARTTHATAQAAQALGWIAKLLADSAPYDELRRDAALVNRTLLRPRAHGPVARRARRARHGREPIAAGRLRQLAHAADRSRRRAAAALSPPASSSSARSSPRDESSANTTATTPAKPPTPTRNKCSATSSTRSKKK